MKLPEDYISKVKDVLRNYTDLSPKGAEQVAETMEDLWGRWKNYRQACEQRT